MPRSEGLPAHKVVIVGGGAAGVAVASALAERRIPMLWFAGRGQLGAARLPASTITEYRRNTAHAWSHFLGPEIGIDQLVQDASPKNRTRRFHAETAEYESRLRMQPGNFVLKGTLVQGGLTNFWGAEVNVFDPTDMALPDDVWSELRRSYSRVASSTAIMGAPDSAVLAGYPDLISQPALPIPATAQQILDRLASHASGTETPAVHLRRSWLAVRTAASGMGGSCTLCHGCLWGCKEGAIHSAGDQVGRLVATSLIQVETQALVEQIRRSADGFRLTVRSTENAEPSEIRADCVFLAAGTPSSTRLALDCAGLHEQWFPFGHTFGFAFVVLMPAFLGRAPPDSGYSLALLSWELNDPARPKRVGGALYSTQGLPDAEFLRFFPLTRPGAISMWKNLRGALLVGNGFLPSDFSRTRVRLRAVGGSLEFNTEPNVDVRGEATAAVKVLARRLRRTGAIIIPGSLRIMPAGADFHYGATLPHGHDGPNGTDMLGQLRGVPGLHVVDGSVLPRLSSRHPTLTIMANADRIARMVRDAL